jgi:hypothetical protein
MLVAGCGYRLMRFVRGMGHGSKLQNREVPAVPAHALLQEENGTGRCEPYCQADGQQDRDKNRHHGQNTNAIEDALDA